MWGVSVLGPVWAQGRSARTRVCPRSKQLSRHWGDRLSTSTRPLIRISGFLRGEEASSFSSLLRAAESNHTGEFMDRKFNYLSYFLFARFLLSLVNLIFLILMKLPGKIESLPYVNESNEPGMERHRWTWVWWKVLEPAKGGVRLASPGSLVERMRDGRCSWAEGQGCENTNYPKDSFLEARNNLNSVTTCSVSTLSETKEDYLYDSIF